MDIVHINPIQLHLSGRHGQPHFQFNQDWLADAVSSIHWIPLSTLAGSLEIHRNTLHNHLQASSLSRQFSDIAEAELNELVHHYKQGRPSASLRFVVAYLKTHGLHVQRERVCTFMQRVDPLGRVLRHQTTVQPWTYEAPWSNYVWHIDGHHKLI